MGSAVSQSQMQMAQDASKQQLQRDRSGTTVLASEHFHSSVSVASNYMVGSAEVELQFRQTYETLRILGRGASAEVHLIRHRESGKEYAVKIVSKGIGNTMNDNRTMQTESTIMSKIQNDHLLGMYELYETPETHWMVLELANGGDLMHGLNSLEHFNEREIAKIFKQLLLGVKYLHSKGIIHRDLKMDNLLFSYKKTSPSSESSSLTSAEDLEVKIADFGLSALTKLKRNEMNSNKMKNVKALKEMWGTVEYFAPEVYQRAYGFQADIWSLGCILYEMLTGEIAFPTREIDHFSIIDKLMFHGKKPPRMFELKSNYQLLSAEAKSFIKGMLKRNPSKRLDIDECLQHPWIIENTTTTTSTPSSSLHYTKELLYAKKVVKERSERRHRRYAALVKELERDKIRSHALARLKVF